MSRKLKNISIYISNLKIKFEILPMVTDAVTDNIQFTQKLTGFNMMSRLMAIRKVIKNHVFFNYTENEKVSVINTERRHHHHRRDRG